MSTFDRPRRWRSHSPARTRAIGRAIAQRLERGDVVALFGELGSGKTTLVRGLALGLGVAPEEPVSSPTFVLLQVYHGRLVLYHLDLYRLSSPQELFGIGIEELLSPDGVTVIEWADRAERMLPATVIRIDLRTVGPRVREIALRQRNAQG